jgi:hypothetical protein
VGTGTAPAGAAGASVVVSPVVVSVDAEEGRTRRRRRSGWPMDPTVPPRRSTQNTSVGLGSRFQRNATVGSLPVNWWIRPASASVLNPVPPR